MPLFLYGYDVLGNLKVWVEKVEGGHWEITGANVQVGCILYETRDGWAYVTCGQANSIEEAVWLALEKYKKDKETI